MASSYTDLLREMNEEDAARENQNTELGSARSSEMTPSANYSGLAQNLDAGTASISLDAANDVDPDNAAAINNTAKKLGASPKLVESSYDSALKELKRREQEEALRGRPRTQKYLTDPEKARLASDDVSILGEIENTFTYGPQAPASGFIKYSGSVPSGIARLRESYRKFELEQLGDIRGDSWREFSKSLDQFFGDLGDDLKKFGASIEVPADKKNYVLDVLEVGGQMAGQALPLAIPVVGPAIGTSLMVVAGADETGEILDKTPGGSDTDRFLALALGGATTGVLEKIGIDKLIDGIGVGKNIKNRFTRFLVNRTLGGAAIEVTEETAEAALRDGIVKLLVDPKREILEDFTAYEASVAGGAGGLFRSVLGIRRARSTGDDLRDQIDKARQSKLLGRDPEAFEEFYQSLVDGTESDEVRLSVEGLVNELNQTGGDPVDFLQTLGVDLAEAQKALDNGGDISINRGKFVTEIAASEGRDDILRHVRSDDGAMTVAEAEVESAAIQERVAEAVAQFNETGEMPAAPTPEIATQAEEIGARIAEQIDASGKYTRQGSKAIGSVYEALFRTIASDYAAEGKEFDLEGIAAELGVDVRAVPFADRASPVTGDETLGGPQREPFDQETSGFPLAVGEDRQFPVEGAINSMTPDEFLDRAPPLEIDEEARETIDALKAHIQSGGRLDALIADTRTDEEKAAGVNRGREDGRHRAMAAKELGIDSVPVITPGTPQPAEQSGFDDYRAQVDPGGRTIPDEDRPNLRMGDMYGMLPQDAEVVSELDDGITIYRGPNGDYYATALNPDLGEQDVVGYIQGFGDNGTELAVVQEMQGRGIGSELQYLFRSENPFAPTGGLTEAGARRLEGTYNRLYDEGVITPEELDLQQSPDFQKFFEGSKVVDQNGAPLRVFRGEHGEVTGSVTTLLPSITFTDQPAEASLYAQDPNQSGQGMKPVAPRVSPAFLSIKNPIINEQRNPEIDSEIADPFIDYGVLVDAIGLEKTIDIARRINIGRPVEDTGLWDEEFSADYDSFEDLVDRAPERVAELYNIAFAVLDDPGAVEALKAAGYDGAIHGGYGGELNTMEYRVFDESQIRSAIAPDELFQDDGIQDDGGHQFRISTRLPTTMRAEEDPVAENLVVDLEAMRFKPAAFKHNMELLKKYPGFSTRSRNPDKIAEEFLEFTTNNLLWLFDSVPPETRERSKLWYDGARAMSERIAEDHGIPVQSVAAVMAALSPQKDWYQNASLGERLIDIHQKFTQGNAIAFMPDNKMKATSRRIFGKDKYKKQRLAVMKSTYADLTEAGDRAMWLRIYDETYNPRGFRVLSPEGNFVGEPSGNVAWGSLVEITKAVRALEDPSLENLTAIMGAKHKVRNFYNNILAPNAPDGDVTIDTHAVAAALIRGLSGGSAEVHHNFGSSPGKDKQPKGWQAAKNINDNGAQGTYGIYAEAYRRAAKQRGVSPRELQSITWEAARGLFTAKFKQNAKNVAAIDAIWYDYQRGKIDLDEARNRILERADGINQPDWVDQRDTDNATIGDTSYAGELAGLRISRRGPGRLGTGDGDPGGTGELFQGDDGGGGVARLYSAARRATKSLKQEKATASQWLSHFKKSGVKDDEITWIVGLEEFLNSQKGAISRDDVRAFVDQNGIQVRETVLDNKPPPVRKWATEVAIPLAERYLVDEGYTLEAGEAGTFIFLDDFLVREGLTDAEVVEYAESLDFNIGRQPEQSRKKVPQFTQYSMDGNRGNDQEFYLNLPAKLSTGNATVKDWTQPTGHTIGETLSDTRNIIRIRTNNRTFEDGRKVLFIEEMQDDRGQAARDLGVQEMDFGAEAELAEAEFAALKQDATDFLDDERINIFIEELGETRDAGELLTAFRDANDEFQATNSRFTWEDRFQDHAELMSEDTRAAVNEYIEAALSGERIDGSMQSNRVPARPFIGSNKVLPLALKRMIIEAVEQGQDAIAWTPGDVQNDRYNLRRVVDKLRLYSNKDAYFREVVTLHGIREGNVRFEQDVKDVDELSKLIGKDRAEKMFADLQVSETNESLLEGDDLEIGGEGMRKYYDKMVVSQANTIGKKFGAKVEVGQTRTGDNEREFYSEFDRPGMLREAGYTRDQYPDADDILQITQETIPFPEPVFAETLEAESRELEAKRMELELAIFDEMRDTDFYQRTEENRDGFFPRKPTDFIRAIETTVPNSVLEVEQFPGYDDLPAAQKFLITEYLEVFYERAETDAMAAYGEQYLTRLQIDAPTDGYPLDLMMPSLGVDINVIRDRALWNQVQGALEKSQDVWTLPITDKMRDAVLGSGLPLFQDPKDPLGSFNPTERVINLFEKADQSTLLHESGHAFVDILGRLVARGDAPARIVDNYNAMLNWVGAESANDLNLNINGDAAREKQELLAQAFEAYLMEGQAPSAELQGAFQMFRQWLINIYRRVRRLEVEVDPTISAVFDRMLATDNEIAEMEQVNAFDFTASPSVTSIMSDEERARHDALSAAASEAARNERVLEERAAEAREQQAWWQEEYQNALERAEAAVYERPEYKAYYFLTRGEFYNGNTPANLEGRRISKQALLDLGYTQQQLNSLPRGARRIYTTKEEAATDPELFAAFFGFADTNEMMDVFLSMRPAKDAIEFDAGTIMRSEHGDPMNDGTMERITEERLFNDERYSAIEMELNALATQTGQQPVGRRLVKAIVDRVFAEETVGGLLTPMRYQAASVRAAREAERAAAKGDFEKAFMKKRQQLLNHEMFRRSLQARDEIQKISQKMKTYQRRKYSPKQVDPEYIGEIKSFLSFFEFGQRSKSGQIKAEQAKALMDFIEARQAKGMPIILPGELVEVASLDPETGAPNVVFKTKHWRDMTMPEIRGLRDMADNLYKIGRDNSAEKKAERRARGEELADGILASTKRRRGKQDPLSIPTRDEKVKESKRSRFSAWHRKMESMLYQLDGFKNLGPMYRGVFEKLARASDVKTQLVEKARTDFDDALRLYDKDVLAKMQTLKSAASIAALGGARLTREQRVTIALNWGSESNREAVLEDDARKKQFGALWNEDAIQQILETLDDTDWAFVQKIWTDIDSYWEDISLKDGSTIDGVKSLEMEQTGIAPPKVEASPFVVGERELPGGYYPLMYDNLSDARAHKETEQDLLNKLQSGGFTRAATSHGFTIARVGSGGRPVRLDLGVLYAHLDEVSQDLAYREAIQQAAEILGNNDVQEAIRATMGEPYRKSLEAILLATATGNMHSSDAAKDSAILRTARLNVTVGVMGFNVRSLLTQPLGLTQSIARIGAKEVGKGVAWLFANPTKINERIASVNELSAYMTDRAKTMTRELDDMTSKLGRESRLDKIRQFGYAPMVFLDVVTVAYPTWWGAFDSAMNGRAEGIDAGDEKSAILYADNIVRATQGSGGAQNLSMVQQSSEAWKLMTMFYGYFNTTFNLQAEAYNRARADGSSLPRALLKRDFIGQTMMLQIIPAILSGLLLEKWPDEEELEEDATWAWTKWSLAQFVNHGGAQMAVVRDVASGITSPFGFSITAADSFGKAAVDVGKFSVKYIESQVDEDEEFELSPGAVKRLARALGTLGGIPGTSQLVRTGDYLYKLSRDELKREPENVAELLQGALMLGDR